jgi:hypothetical protein
VFRCGHEASTTHLSEPLSYFAILISFMTRAMGVFFLVLGGVGVAAASAELLPPSPSHYIHFSPRSAITNTTKGLFSVIDSALFQASPISNNAVSNPVQTKHLSSLTTPSQYQSQTHASAISANANANANANWFRAGITQEQCLLSMKHFHTV